MRHLLLDPAEIADAGRDGGARTRTEDDPTASSRGTSAIASCPPVRLPVIGWTSNPSHRPAEIGLLRHLLRAERPRGGPGLPRRGAAREDQRAFGAIPRGADPPPVLRWSPRRGGAARHRHRDAQLPIVYIAYHVPTPLGGCAGARGPLDGPVGWAASRLYTQLVRDRSWLSARAGLLLLLGRSKPLLVLGEPDAGTDAEASSRRCSARWCV